MAVFLALRVALALALSAPLGATGAQLEAQSQSPVFKVVDLIRNLKATIEGDGKVDQQSYDKYACWCEATLGRKAVDIDNAKATLEKLAVSIPKLAAEVSSNDADVEHLKRELAQNLEATESATGVRDSENTEYQGTKADSENCVGALEAAVRALSGAGAGKKAGFMSISSRQAELMSVAAGIRQVIAKDTVVRKVQRRDLDALRHFVERPADFAGPSPAGSSFSQVGNNPFGDYAPKSTQIQGILKGMYDSMLSDMEKNHGEESNSQKAFQELMATKQEELKDLQATLESHTLGKAEKAKMLADSKVERDDTEAQQKADETFFEATKDGCKVKAEVWNDRSRLRTEELQGITAALKILTDPKNRELFTDSANTFLQVASSSAKASRTYKMLEALQAKYHGGLNLARIAVEAKLGGHFDKVIGQLDHRVEELRAEEQADIEHKDRCENAGEKNKNDMEDLTHQIAKAGDDVKKIKGTIFDLDNKIDSLEGEIKESRMEKADMLRMRNAEHLQFKQALKDDADAIKVINGAIKVLMKFYKKNNIPMSLQQQDEKDDPEDNEPEYSIDRDEAPDTSFGDDGYTGKQGQSGGVLGMMRMIVEDTEKEMKEARTDEAEAKAQFDKDTAALDQTLEALGTSKAEAETRSAELGEKKADTEAHQVSLQKELQAQKDLKNTLTSDCAWVATHFEKRRAARKAEIQGLQEAKSMLAGVEAGDFDEVALAGAAKL